MEKPVSHIETIRKMIKANLPDLCAMTSGLLPWAYCKQLLEALDSSLAENTELKERVRWLEKRYKLLHSAVNGDTTWVNAVERAETAEAKLRLIEYHYKIMRSALDKLQL